MGMKKLVVAFAAATVACAAVPAQAEGMCGGHQEGYLHLRISPAQDLYGRDETVKVNAEVVRRLPTGDTPVEGAEVYVALHSRRFVVYDREITDVDGQATLRLRSDHFVPGLADAGGRTEVTYTDIHQCIDPSHEDAVTREDFVRIVK